MDMSQVSIIEIIVGTLIGMALGAFWYSPIAFGQAWMDAIGKTPDTLGSQTAPMLGSVLDNLFCGWGARLLAIQSGYRIASVCLMSVAMVYV